MSFAQSRPNQVEGESPDLSPPQLAAQACWAAVSFLFEDAIWCDWIYREFDGMRVPRPLAGRPSRHGTPYPERVSVSPDPADPQQLENYCETLKTAQHLIIVVSPGSAREEHILEHMRLFRNAGGEERIIALIVKGEPASPSAEPGCEADREWLPQWLEWRFKDNAFEPAPSCEPIVVDARLGISSLAEVRAQLCAAILEVPVPQLAELGVAIRGSTAHLVMQASPVILPMPEPTPLPTLASIATPESAAIPRPARWPVLVCSAAAIAALGCLAFWPAKPVAGPTPNTIPGINLKPSKQNVPSANLPEPERPATQVRESAPLVAVVPVDATAEKPLLDSKLPPAPVKTEAAVTAAIPMTEAKPAPTSLPPAPLDQGAAMVDDRQATSATNGLTPADGPGAKPVTINPAIPPVMTAESEAAERKIYELASRRDRLIRLAENKVSTGEVDEAIASFQQAIETAHELVNRTDGGHDEVIELALLYRRFGNFASGVNSAAEGRTYYERGRRALQALRAKGKLPREAFKILTDLENAARGRD